VISNAGGINTNSCVAALKMACIKAGIKIVVTIIQSTFALFYAEEKEG